MSKCIRIKPGTAPEIYRQWASGTDGEYAVVFPSYTDAHVFVRLAGGTDIRRVGAAWQWTMPDGASATLDTDPDDRTVVFVPATA
jgi:hypothetical protein